MKTGTVAPNNKHIVIKKNSGLNHAIRYIFCVAEGLRK
jgi:hypothetical protein